MALMEFLRLADRTIAMDEQHEEQVAVVLGQRQLVAVCCMFLVVLGLVATLSYVTGRSITAAQMRNADESLSTPPIIVDPRKSGSSTPLETRAASAMPTAAPVTPQQVIPIPPASPPVASREAVRTVTASMQGETPFKAATPSPQPDTRQPSPPPARPSPAGNRTHEPAQLAAKNPPARPTTNIGSEPGVAATAAPLASEHPSANASLPATRSVEMPAAGETFWQVGVVDHKLASEYVQKLSSLGLPVRLAPGQSAEGRRVLVGPFHSSSELESARKVISSAGYQHFLRRF